MESTEQEKPGSGQIDLPSTSPLHKELYFLIAKFLSGGPCQRASEVLIQEIERHEIIPSSVNWLGEPVREDFRTFSSKFDHISPEHLPKLLDQLVKTINAKELSSSQLSSRSLLSFSTCTLLNKGLQDDGVTKKCSTTLSWSKKSGYNALLRSLRGETRSTVQVHAISDRPLVGTGISHSILQPEFYERMQRSCCTLGHLAGVYCVLFDVSGQYIFTGADDHLIKIWSALDGRLISTLRGTSGEIVDLTVNQENTMLAVASVEKVIRIWCLRTGAPIATLTAQGGNTTSIFFCPMPRSRSSVRYLTSTSTDGSCAFWAYSDEPGEPIVFQQKPTLYLERMRPGNAKMICSAFSSGGLFMAAGSADNHVRIYYMLGTEGPERILEVEHHSDRVDSISWCNEGLRFVSGSKDGTALIWRFENACWRYIRLHCSKIPGEVSVVYDDPKRRPKVNMVAWNRDDSLVLTAVSDFMIRVWNSKTGELIRVLKEHSEEAYVIEPHPINPRIFLTAGHDGKLILWDVGTTNKNDKFGKVYKYHNLLNGQGHGSLFDCKWAPDGFSFAATDSHGHVMIFAVDSSKENNRYKKIPEEMFFHTDYRPISRDAITGEILDEQTQIAPHAMPPPFLVDMEGNPYPANLQRLVPGRENMKDEYLIPQVAVSQQGYQEVIEGIPARSNIDEMIQQLARAQGLGGQEGEEGDNHTAREGGGERRGVGQRRSGEIEGVRQSRGNWQADCYGFQKKNYLVAPLSQGLLERCENERAGLLEFEENWYMDHLTKCPVSGAAIGTPAALGSPVESPEGRSRRIRRLAAQAAERRQMDHDDEASFAQLEGVARPNPRPQQEISVSQVRPPPRDRRAGTARQGGGSFRPRPTVSHRRVGIATLNDVNNANNAPNNNSRRRPRPVRYDVRRIIRTNGSDIENMDLEDSSSEASVDTSSSDSESSDSDWGGNLGASQRRREREQETRRNNTTGEGRPARTTRTQSNSSPDEQEEEDEENDSDHEEGESNEPRPGPSTEITASVKSEPKPTRPRKTKAKVDYSGGVEEIAPEFRPSDWLSETFPQRSPYFPQLGDDLVYFRQGHECYIKNVEDKKLYQIPKKMKKSLPYVVKPELEPEVSVRVVGIKFEIEPPRVAIVKLARTDWNTGELLRNENLYVKYHDVATVVDFLILRHMYDNAIRRKWNEGDRFRCLIGRDWWLGTVIKLDPHSEQYPKSNYLCYKAKWDNGDPETMSPWDMHTIPDDFVIPDDGKDGIAATDEDLRLGLYEPVISDWPPHGHQDAQCQKLSGLLEQVMALSISEAFLTPVDLNKYPDYAYHIDYPIDLSTIKARLDNRFYRRIEALKFDITFISMNAEKFNQSGSDIVKHARVVRDVCFEIVTNPDVTSVNPIYHKISKNESSTSTSTSRDGRKQQSNKSSSKSSSKGGGKSQSQGHTSSSTSKKMQLRGRHEDSEDEDDRDWREQCLDLLNEIYNKKDAVPFREAVDIIEYPEYYQQIDTPVDLGTIREDLLGNNYVNVQAFHKDMMLVFSNSKQFNQERSAIYAMTCRLQSLYECQIKLILKKRKTQGRRPVRGSSSSPMKRGGRRPPLRGTSSAASTPRKNPRRSTAGKIKHNYSEEEEEESDDDQEQRNPSRELRTRGSEKRRSSIPNGNGSHNSINSFSTTSRSSRMNNGHATTSPGTTTTPSRNGSSRYSTESSGGSGGRPARPVKRLRISSEERSPPPRRGSPQRGANKSNQKPATSECPLRASPRKHKIIIKNEPETDEFEDSHDEVNHMPVLDKVKNDVHDEDYQSSAEDDTDEYEGEESNDVRRSTRTTKRGHGGHDDYGYETRNRGRATKSYAEPQDDVSDDDDGRFKRRKILNSSNSTSSPSRGTRSHLASQPPVLRRRASSEEESEAGGDDNEEEDEDPNLPGPSSRLMRPSRNIASTSPNKTKVSPSLSIHNALEDDDDDEEEDESESEDEENSDDSDDDDVGNRNRGRRANIKSSRAPQRQQRRPLRQKQNNSDDEEYEQGTPRKSKSSSSSRGRPTRGRTHNYAEESEDSEPQVQTTVSLRGRVRRTKSFTQRD